MALEIEVIDKKLTALFDDELTIYTANQFRDAFAEHLKGLTHISINLSKVTEIDSAGLQFLVAIKKLSDDCEVEFIEHSSAVTDVLAVCGLSGQFNDSVFIPREPLS